jgi:tetratricopeptide (TPR) repeat protein
MLVALALLGVLIGFRTARRAPSIRARRRAGALLLSLMVLSVVALGGALAHSHRGLFGSISHGVDSLTNPNAPVPANTPGRLTAIGSVRARYWKEALEVFQANPALGAGAEGYATASLRYRTVLLDARHAHGFIVQTLADLGLAGLVLALALLIAWMTAAGRSTHPFGRRWQQWRWRGCALPYSAERIGMLSLLCVVVVFGVHSFVDWTWYVPGDACVALLCAGWLAGRGALEDRGTDPSREQTIARWQTPPIRPRAIRIPPLSEIGRVRALVGVGVLVATVLAVWAQWQPQHSVNASERALALVEAGQPKAALSEAQTAINRDPLSVEALFRLAAVQQSMGQSVLARATLARSVHSQPSNPQTWQTLGEYDLNAGADQMARNELRAAVFLNPQSVETQNDFVLALRATPAPASRTPTRALRAPGARLAPRGG